MPETRLIPAAALLFALLSQSSEADIQQVTLEPQGIHRYSASVSFEQAPAARPYLIDTGAAYSLVPKETIERLALANAARYLGQDLVRAVDGRTFHLDKFRLHRMQVGGCRLSDVVVYAAPADRGILGMSTLSRFSPITFDIDAQRVSINCTEH